MVLHLHILLVFYLLNNLGIMLGPLATTLKKVRDQFGQDDWRQSAPVIWNALPPSLRVIDNITSFKKQLKTHLFRKAYF